MANFLVGIYRSQKRPTGKDRSCATMDVMTILGRRSESSMLIPEPRVQKIIAMVHIRMVFFGQLKLEMRHTQDSVGSSLLGTAARTSGYGEFSLSSMSIPIFSATAPCPAPSILVRR